MIQAQYFARSPNENCAERPESDYTAQGHKQQNVPIEKKGESSGVDEVEDVTDFARLVQSKDTFGV